jgi:hypothetical protein
VNKDERFSIRTLGWALDNWGFTFGKGTRSQHLKEKDHVIAARRRYLREKRANRIGNETIPPEVYLDESYVNKNHSNDFIGYSKVDGPLVQKPTGKGERLIIINAITKDGWVPNAKLVFKSTKRTGDCLKAELIEVLAKMVTAPTYAIDEIAAENGHKIIRTPPYHPELQPIETCWEWLKMKS